MTGSREPTVLNEVLAGAMARLALRQQNLAVLLPVMLHEVNGSLNGLALSTELLSRLSPQARAGDDAGTASNLLLRTKNELGRLKVALKGMESRLLPGVAGQAAPRRAAVGDVLRDVQDVLLPAVRRGQHELRLAAGAATDVEVPMRVDELFDLLAALLIITIEAAPSRSVFDVEVAIVDGAVAATTSHAGVPQANIALEVHRDLLRLAAAHAGGGAEWQRVGGLYRARLRLPRHAAG